MPSPPITLQPPSLSSNCNVRRDPPSREYLRREIGSFVDAIISWVTSEETVTFNEFERSLIPRVFALGRLFLELFLCASQEREEARLRANAKGNHRRTLNGRSLNTFFGVIHYWRSYVVRSDDSGDDARGFPLDVRLGLFSDRISMNVLSLATRLSTRLAFAQVREVLTWFSIHPPSTEVIEQSVLGLGRYTRKWFEQAKAPEKDGDVLIIMADGKGSPMATEQELARRRGKRRPIRAASPRHRGLERRNRYGSTPRRKKGDKSKNAKMATMVVMYTLRRSGAQLLGPLNKRVYASFAPKRHVFEIARREADKRGFRTGSGRTVQIVTDGDENLADYAKEFFPDAIHTIDVMHVIEYLWIAGEALHREGSSELSAWVDEQKDRLYRGKIEDILSQLQTRLARIPVTGPGNKGRRTRLQTVIGYLKKREANMNYGELTRLDLELGSGAVEGAIKNIIGARFDHGGMRWIKERAEALLQLRCIEVNGDWDAFVDSVHADMKQAANATFSPLRLQQLTPEPLPTLAKAA